MPETVAVKPELIRWAIDRSRLSARDLAEAFPRLDDWRQGVGQPTYKQLERFAAKTMTPLAAAAEHRSEVAKKLGVGAR